MGREARCTARWGARHGEVTALLESTEVIVRGAFRARAPLATVREVRAENGTLRFRTGEDEVGLDLGPAAARWAAAMLAPPPSLAKKLGIAPQTRYALEGTVDDEALAAALAGARRVRTGEPDLIVARVDDAGALERAVRRWSGALEAGVPLWAVYVKGKAAPLGETAVRDLLRARELIDLKVAAVSSRLTALQFVRRRSRARFAQPPRTPASRS